MKQLALTSPEIRAEMHKLGVELSGSQAEQVRRYIELLLLWNQSLSLTSITDIHQILSRHFFESMFVAQIVDFSHGRLADVGSGAGFPGLGLKIIAPGLQLTLIESNLKKCAFLKEVIRTIGLSDCLVHQGRLDSFSAEGSSFDFVTSRALGQFDSLLDWASAALTPSGCVLLWIGADDASELRKTLAWSWREPVSIPGSDRRVILIGSR
jgi:16S rRNA (guanine527-N7)-methyltransferase